MSKRSIGPSFIDPLVWKMVDGVRGEVRNIQRKMYDKQDSFSYWNQMGDFRQTLAALAGRLDEIEARIGAIVKLMQGSQTDGGRKGRGVLRLAGSAPLTQDAYGAEAA